MRFLMLTEMETQTKSRSSPNSMSVRSVIFLISRRMTTTASDGSISRDWNQRVNAVSRCR